MHTQPRYNKPFTEGRLDNQPKGIYIANDYWYDENGNKHHIPNRRKRRAIEAEGAAKGKRSNCRKSTAGRRVQVIDGKQIAHTV